MNVQTGIKAGQGLGDAVANFTQATGLDRLAKAYEQMTGKSCGCKQRQAMLNNLVPALPQLSGS